MRPGGPERSTYRRPALEGNPAHRCFTWWAPAAVVLHDAAMTPEGAVPQPAEDDEGILDDVEEVIDDVLGENLPAPEQEDPWERRVRVLDAMTAVILAIAAVATAWATFQSSQWAGAQSDAVAASARARTESVRASAAAGQSEQIDTAMWLDWIDAVGQKDTARERFVRERFRPSLAAAFKTWSAKAVLGPGGTIVTVPPGTPFSEPGYAVPAQKRADDLSAEAEHQLAVAQEAGTRSTRFVIAALVLALVLFFAGIATKFRNPRTQALLVALAVAFIVFGLERVVTLDQLL
jgi:hypothetical protein